MRTVLIAAGTSLVLTLLATPLFIRVLVRQGYGQFIRDDGPTTHHTKRGTPTMGGAVIIAAVLVSYLFAHLVTLTPLTYSALLVLFLMTGLGAVGMLDDVTKIRNQRSLGLKAWQKLTGQSLVAITFAVLALQRPNEAGRTPASTAISFIRDIDLLDLAVTGAVGGTVLFIAWAYLLIAAASNGVNLTDGLDGLATGASLFVFGAYTLIGIWQSGQSCLTEVSTQCYEVRDPRDLAVVAAALLGACFGFLWWNASPAKIFMGDTGSLALGGAIAGLAITTRTELLLIILGGLFVIITASVIIQVAGFKLTGKRVFRMAPLQHHFELKGWNEVTIVIRFWIIAGLCVGAGLGVFYAEWVVGA
ncbi:phospho-N-acetylmuramoyl-pentapeptide-transferase [Jannaschia sp. R86511]|uniref:phospho-N-acetylmuramoyl-pentapeptide- transferase n=1 Tax=Jannaschia sp. R86511 TaxID=3093853 RepID=UPI0036D2F4C0